MTTRQEATLLRRKLDPIKLLLNTLGKMLNQLCVIAGN